MGLFEDDFCDILRKARYGLGISVRELTASTGLSAERIEALEADSGGLSATRAEIEALGRALNLGPEALGLAAAGEREPASIEGHLPESWELVQIVLPPLNANAYLLIDHLRAEALIVDPGAETEELKQRIADLSVPLQACLLTHTHHDHVGALPWLLESYPELPVVAHPSAVEALQLRGRVYAPADGEMVRLGGFDVTVWHLPGHSPDGLAFRVAEAAFVGDTLFAGSLGRSERGPITYDTLLASARRLLTLPPSTVLLPGHGPPTTVAAEGVANPFLAVDSPAGAEDELEGDRR